MLRGTLDASELGLKPEGATAQSRGLQELLNIASDDDRQLFLPAGTYLVGDLQLPPRTRLAGVPGATKLVFSGGQGMITGERAEVVELTGLVIDGAGKPLADYIPGIVHLAECCGVSIENCTVIRSSGSGPALA